MVDYNIRVAVDADRAQQQLARVERRLTSIGTRADRVRASFNTLFTIFSGALGASLGLRTLREFEQQMATVRAITGATAEEFDLLTKTAQDLGATTRFTATEAAGALEFLARAGLGVAGSIGAARPALTLAQAGALDLASAADIATNALTAFQAPIEELPAFMDRLAFTAANSNTTVQELAVALKFAGPGAKAASLSFSELSAVFAILAQSGIRAHTAGTSVRRLLQGLRAPSGEAKKVFDSLGLSVADLSTSYQSLADVLNRLVQAGIGAEGIRRVFDVASGPSFEILSGAIPLLREFTAELDNAGGTSERIAAIMDDNLNGAFFALASAAEAVLLQFAQLGYSDSLERFVRGQTELLRALARDVEILESALQALALTVAFVLGPAALGGLLRIAGRLIGLFRRNIFGAAIIGLIAFADQIPIFVDSLLTLQDLFVATFEEINSQIDSFIAYNPLLVQAFGLLADVASFLGKSLLVAGLGVAVLSKEFLSLFGIEFDLNRVLTRANALADERAEKTREQARAAAELADAQKGAVGTQGISPAAQEALRAEGYLASLRRQRMEVSALDEALSGLADTIGRPLDPSQDQPLIDRVKRELELNDLYDLRKDAIDQVLGAEMRYATSLRYINLLLEDGTINAERYNRLRAELELQNPNPQLRRQAELLDQINGRQDRARETLAALSALYAAGKINLSEYNEERRRTLASLEGNETATDRLINRLNEEYDAMLRAAEGGREYSRVQAQIAGLPIEDQATAAALAERNELMSERLNILRQLDGGLQDLIRRESIVADLYRAGRVEVADYTREMRRLNLERERIQFSRGEGTFGEALAHGFELATQGAKNLQVTLGTTLSDAIVKMGDGFAMTIGQAIWDTSRLDESLKKLARDAISEVITGLIQAFLRAVILENAITAIRGLGGLSLFGIPLFSEGGMVRAMANGGLVSGRGGPRSDSVPAFLSPGEYVVNAEATKKNYGLLNAINRGQNAEGAGGRPAVNITINVRTPDVTGFRESEKQLGRQAAAEFLRYAGPGVNRVLSP